MKPEIRNGGAHIDTDIPQPTDFDSVDTAIFYFEVTVFVAAAFMLAAAGVASLFYFGVI